MSKNSTEAKETEPENLPFEQKMRKMETLSKQMSFSSTTQVVRPMVRRQSIQHNPVHLPTTSEVIRMSEPVQTSNEETVSVQPTSSEVETAEVLRDSPVSALPASNETEPVMFIPALSEVKNVSVLTAFYEVETKHALPVSTEVKTITILPASPAVETEAMLMTSSNAETVELLTDSSKLETNNVLTESNLIEVASAITPPSSISKREIANVLPTGSKYTNIRLNDLSTTQDTEDVNDMPHVTDESDKPELRCKSTIQSSIYPRLINEDKNSPNCACSLELKNNSCQRTHNTEKKYIYKPMYIKSGPDIDFLMIGKTGNGKSALGNFLLQQVAFESKASTTSVTKNVTYEVTEFNGRKIKVVDSPGVGDTDWTDDATEKFVSEAMAEAISINPRGYHAFLLVVRFGGRFTKEDKGTVDYLKKMYGQNFVKRYCVLVMTCGDLFQQDVQDVSFKEWIDGEKGVVAELVKECDHRVLLFDNKTKDEAKIQKQLNEMIQMVDTLTNENSRYTNQQFKLAQSEREKFIVNSHKPIIAEETMAEANIILQHFKRLQDNTLNDSDITLLEELLERTDRLNDNLVQKDCNSGVLKDLIDHVQSIRNSISDEIKLRHRVAQYMKSLRQEHEVRVTEEMKRRSDILDHVIDENRKMYETKVSMFMVEIDSYKKKLAEKTKEIEKNYSSLKTNNKHLFKAIKKQVAKTFKRNNRLTD